MKIRVPDTIFVRLAAVVTLGFVLSQLIILFLFWAGAGHSPPTLHHETQTVGAASHPLPPLPWKDVLIDQSVQFLMALLAVWLGTRWIVRPIRHLAQEATRLQNQPSSAPLQPEGPLEVRQAAIALNQMQQRLLYHLRERQRFLAAISHDLRTPLTRMRLRAESLQHDDVRERTRADIAEMTEMLDMVLHYFKGQTANEPLQTLDLQALVETIVEDHRELGHAVTTDGSVLPFGGHPVALRRLLENLIGNALLYGKQAHISLTDAADVVRIDIQDYGAGMTADEMARALEPFVRIEASRNRGTGGGFGLGLTIANEIVRQHGGTLTMSNTQAAGLCVSISLPRRPPEADEV